MARRKTSSVLVMRVGDFEEGGVAEFEHFFIDGRGRRDFAGGAVVGDEVLREGAGNG